MKNIVLAIDGMTCSACSNGLEKYLNKQTGIVHASVNLVFATASVDYDEQKLSLSDLNRYVQEAGFTSLGEFKSLTPKQKNLHQMILFAVFSIMALFVLYVSMAVMMGAPQFPFLQQPFHLNLVLGILSFCFLLYGWDILKNGYKNFVHLTPNMDTLVGIGVLSSFFFSLYNFYLLLCGVSDVHFYFESTAVVIYFVKLGRFIEAFGKDKTLETVQKLVTLTPAFGLVKQGSLVKRVTIDEIKKGDIVVVKAGEKASVDGTVVYGQAHFNEALITGESQPALKTIGSKIVAGSLNYDGYIEYRAEKIGKESTVSEIVKLVAQASSKKLPLARIADTLSCYFVPAVIILAILTFTLHLLFKDSFNDSLIAMVTVLVTACPCALGLATPLAVAVAQNLCLKKGLLLKNSSVLETAQNTKIVVFDKTGTLTFGRPVLQRFFNFSSCDEQLLMCYACSLEALSAHPISVAFQTYAADQKLSLFDVSHFETIENFGITGQIGSDTFFMGNADLLKKIGLSSLYQKEEMRLRREGCSVVYLVQNKSIAALFGIKDGLRPQTKEAVQKLLASGLRVIILSGDHKQAVQKIADELGLKEVIAGVLPKEKTAFIKKLKKQGVVLMCGDGINDSPALMSSDIGISINTGTDIAMDAADVILKNDNFNNISDLIILSRRTVHIIKQNLFWAFFYNVLMLPIATGLFSSFGIGLNPMMASLAMIFSSMTVVLNSQRLRF